MGMGEGVSEGWSEGERGSSRISGGTLVRALTAVGAGL